MFVVVAQADVGGQVLLIGLLGGLGLLFLVLQRNESFQFVLHI